MDFMTKLRLTLESDEGVIHEVYLDHLSQKTCAIGHLCLAGEPEFDLPVGTAISEERVAELFEKDMKICLDDCRFLHSDFDELPDDARLTIASLAFQLGLPRYSLFQKHHAAVKKRDWTEAAAQLRDSKLYRQTPERTERHARRLEGLDAEPRPR
jgi:GH24 family phage-related lysozyme (muramidase)